MAVLHLLQWSDIFRFHKISSVEKGSRNSSRKVALGGEGTLASTAIEANMLFVILETSCA